MEMYQAKTMADTNMVPVVSGEQVISASVNVIYELMNKGD